MSNLEKLQQLFEEIKYEMPKSVNLRTYRCLSWLKKAESLRNDLDMRFISLWIAFNAIYAKDVEFAISDKSAFNQFIHLINNRAGEDLYQITWKKYSSEIRIFLENKFVFQGFWDFHNGEISEEAWLEDFTKEKERTKRSLETQDSAGLLLILFNRIYTLRNQVFHGGATYGSRANRRALINACDLLEVYTELFLQVILENPDESEWGKPYYPYIKE